MNNMEKRGDYYIQLKFKDKWIDQLLDAHEYMKNQLLENGIYMPDEVKYANETPEDMAKRKRINGRSKKLSMAIEEKIQAETCEC